MSSWDMRMSSSSSSNSSFSSDCWRRASISSWVTSSSFSWAAASAPPSSVADIRFIASDRFSSSLSPSSASGISGAGRPASIRASMDSWVIIQSATSVAWLSSMGSSNGSSPCPGASVTGASSTVASPTVCSATSS